MLLKRLLRIGQVLLVAILVCVGFLYWKISLPEPPTLQAFINGNVLTVNQGNDRAEAVLVEGERIIAVGSTVEITSLIQSHKSKKGVVVHDLSGKTLAPGLIDAHSHFPGSGVYKFAADLNAPPIGRIKSIEEMLTQLRLLDAQKDDATWLFGLGYDDSQMLDGRHPLRAELDAVSTSRPIFILHISGHMGVANSLALEIMGISEQSSAPSGGEYVKNSDGQLTGLILETAVFPFLQIATDFSAAEIYEVVAKASFEYAEQGITTAQNGAADKRYATGLKWASKLGLVQQRLIIWPLHDALEPSLLRSLKKESTERYEVGALKIVADGSIQGYTGYLKEPYHVIPDNYEVGFRGHPVIEREELVRLVKTYFSADQALAIHGNGDASIDDILFAVEEGQKEYPDENRRTVLIHAQMARQDQLIKMKELHITPSFFSAHTYYWGDRHRRIFMGSERAQRMSPARSAQRLGLPFSIHLDTPVVPMNTMRLIWSAVNRETSSGRSIGRRERISREQALRAITIDAAYQISKESDLGSIEKGKFADLVVFDRDPTSLSVDLLQTQVLATYVGGVKIFAKL